MENERCKRKVPNKKINRIIKDNIKYACKPCKYSTNRKNNYDRHMTSTKHISTIRRNERVTHDMIKHNIIKHNVIDEAKQLIFECMYCHNNFKRSDGLTKHLRSCVIRNDQVYQESEKDKQIMVLTSNVELLKSILTSPAVETQKFINAKSYLIKNYNNASPLIKLEDYSIIHSQNKKYTLIDTLIYHHSHKQLVKYLGDFIVKIYKKDNPSQQSVWTSDVSRMTYIIRNTINNKNVWSMDNKGVNTKTYIIQPLIDYINTEIKTYIIGQEKEVLKPMSANVMEFLEKLGIAAIIMRIIDDNSLSNEVIKYIAPFFYLNKPTGKMIT